MHKLLLSLTMLLFISCLYSCKKSDIKESESEGTRLKLQVSRSGDSLTYTTYEYDNQGRLSAVLDSTNGGWRWALLISYNNKNQIDSVKWGNGWKSPVVYSEKPVLFEYDNNNRIIRKWRWSNVTNTLKAEHSYGYDSKGKLIADTVYNHLSNNIMGIAAYTYDANDNLANISEQGTPLGNPLNNPKMVYDNKHNSFGNNGLLLYILKGNIDDYIDHLSKNNKVQIQYRNTTLDYSYEYYANGLPKKVSEVDNTDPIRSEVDFYYE